MSIAERFWWLISYSAVAWYLAVTGYVAVRGAFDIRQMLDSLEQRQQTTSQGPDEDR